MKGVIIAAGEGNRLRLYGELPKPLTRVDRYTLIGYNLRSLAAVGINSTYIVIGYKGESIKNHIGDGSRYNLQVEYIFNDKWITGNASSVLAATSELNKTNEPYAVILMSDHIVPSQIIKSLIRRGLQNGEYCVVCVDEDPEHFNLEIATKVRIGKNYIVTDIGKKVYPYDAVDCGVHLIDVKGIAQISRNFKLASFNDIKRLLVQERELSAYIIDNPWIDVNTLEDLRKAEEMVSTGSLAPYFKQL